VADRAWQNETPPPAALRWGEAAAGAGWRVAAVDRLRGGLSHATHRLDLARGGEHMSLVLRRWARPGWQDDDPQFTADHEATCLRLIEGAKIPAPRLIAVDSTAATCDVAAVLQTFLPGSAPTALDSAMVDTLAEVVASIHAVDAHDARARALPCEPYYELDRIAVPDWTHDGRLWSDALDAVSGDPQQSEACFLHRDIHPGNTLWHQGALTGVLDWDRGSWGSPAIDVAHMCWNLAVLHTPDVAARFTARYRSATQRELPDLAWWCVRDALDALPDVESEWGTGRVAAMEAFVREALGELR
jgi:aminoglycoside phosphotransferase (APT) family kinase protein